MKCPNCQTVNPDTRKFCRECGGKLSHICPQCGYENLAEDKFCGECGHALAESEVDHHFDYSQSQTYTPKFLAEKILDTRSTIEGERKLVTVLFADVANYTTISEKLDPEEVHQIMDGCFKVLMDEIHRYEGTIDKFTGDGIMALFGAPIALEDAPQRAIRSALAIQREMTRFSARMKSEIEMPSLKMRVGINTGPVVVGTLGSDLRVDFTAVGDTVNLASRMEGLAEPGTVYVTDKTFKLTEGLFRFEALGERQVKGKEAPVKTYRVISPSTRRTRFDVSAERGLTPFVGRERELELLLDGFERARGGTGQAFSIMGEAGVGKSRLLYEFRKAIANEEVTFLEGKCLSYSSGVAYHLLTDLLKSNFDIRESDEESQIRGKVKEGLNILGLNEPHTLPYLLELLSVRDSGIDDIPMSPDARRDRIIEAVKRTMLRGAEIRPLIVAIEDLHWVDKSSEDAVKYLLETISGARIFLIFTYRPEFVHTWGGRSYHSQVTLNRLSNRESLAIVAHLLGIEDIDRELEELIVEKTEGIPFFIEEFIKSLQDLGVIESRDGTYYLAKDIENITIPSTIQDVIMARVDSLPDTVKGVLQTGSVIEREFSYELIKQVAGMLEQKLLSHLSILRDSELLYERGIYPQSTYIFRHALTREVVYNSILDARKKRLHAEIGNAIEEVYKDNLDQHYEVLVEHYIAGKNYEKGAEYCRPAARKAERAASLNDAIAYGEKRVHCLERLPQNEDVQHKIVDARTTLGLYHMQMNYPTKAKETVDPIVGLALELGYKRRVSQIYTIMGSYSFLVEEDFAKTFKYLEDALKIAEELNSLLSLTMANYWLGIALAWSCQYERAHYHMGRALEINVTTNTLWGISAQKSVMSASIYDFQGRIDLGYRTSQEAMQIAEESGDIWSKAFGYTNHGWSCYCKGFLEEAEEHLLKGIGFSGTINLPVPVLLGHLWLGDTYFDMEEYKKSKDYYEKAIRLFEHYGILSSYMNLSKIASVRAKVMNREVDINFGEIFKCHEDNRYENIKGWMSRYVGEILLNIDEKHISEAEDWIKKAIDVNTGNGVMLHLGKDYALYAELFKRKGDTSKAEEHLNQAIEIFIECGADGWVDKAEQALKAL
jgi:class 3 adenylate cyclase/tetratricopeptide (TPR) repeat protein